MSDTMRHYFETKVGLPAEPLLAAAHLARAGLHAQYMVYERGGDWTYAGGVLAEVTVDGGGARLRRPGAPDAHLPWAGDPLAQVRRLLADVAVPEWRAFGWAAFELSYALHGGPGDPGDGRLLCLVVPETEVRFRDGMACIRAVSQERLAAAIDAISAPVPPERSAALPVNVRDSDQTGYRGAVKLVVEEIHHDQLSKAIISRVVDIKDDLDLVRTYVLGRQGNSPARSFLLNLGGLEAAGFSPEIVVSVSADGAVTSQPLAGTRALTGDRSADERLRNELYSSAKEVYEHAISVKTAADELARVCAPASVGVPEFMTVRERGSVQHLASRVSGRLAAGSDAWDAFAAVFPSVTASGIPKDAAFQAIRRHEPEPRGLYSGAVLTVDQAGALDAALVLRSVYRQGGRTWLRAGAGIVGQSTPEREFEETCEKLDSVARFLVPAAGHH